MAMDDEVKVWDKWGKEQRKQDIARFHSWELCRREKRFPNGLIEFLSSEQGCDFPQPTTIQSYSWPALLQGMDLIGIAKTGSGKTLAFLLPAFMWLKKNKKSAKPVDLSVGPAVLCLTPTRELCHQIYTDAAKFGEPVSITAACCYGGPNKREQEYAIRQGPHCLIATPGRLNDFLNTDVVSSMMCRFCIVDEADRMLDMGFEPQIRQILERCPVERQTSLFTATWNPEVRAIADQYIRNPVVVQVGTDQMTSNKNITQHIEICDSKEEKREALQRILEEYHPDANCLVFCNTKRQCRDLCWELSSTNLNPMELHGDIDQNHRDEAIQGFKDGSVRLLIATDVASRGLDVRKCNVVVNWDAPNHQEDYVHRIGRTGRATDKGDAYTFIQSYGQQKQAHDVLKTMRHADQDIPQELEDIAAGKSLGRYAPGGSSSSGPSSRGGNNSNEKRVHPSDKGKTAYTYNEFKGFCNNDTKKADRMWNESKPVAGQSNGGGLSGNGYYNKKTPAQPGARQAQEEQRIHPSDKAKTPYTYQGFLDFCNGDAKKAQRMWTESKPVAQPAAPAQQDGEEWRVHPSDKDKTPYTFDGFLSFCNNDKRKAERMWTESTAVEVAADEFEEPVEEEFEAAPEDEEMQEELAEDFADGEAFAEQGEDEFGVKREWEEDDEFPDEPDAKRARIEHDEDERPEIERKLLDGEGMKIPVQELKEWLSDQGLSSAGLKAALVKRAEEAVGL